MDRPGRFARRWGPALGFVVLFALSLHPIKSYDYFWHLATGRWIVEHHALPLHDPFALASDRAVWINGEWLFQIVLYGLWSIIGHTGTVVVEAMLVALVFAWMIRRVAAEADEIAAIFLVFISWLQAAHRLDVRPETAAVLLLPIAIALLRERPTIRRTVLASIVGIIWINVHPSALLLPVVAVCFTLGDLVAARAAGSVPPLRARLAQFVAISAALLVNPWGFEALLAPVRLARYLRDAGIVNTEWLPTDPFRFPLVYALVAAALALLLVPRARAKHAGSTLVLIVFAALAIRFVRNHGLLFAAMPLIVGSAIPKELTTRIRSWLVAAIVATLAFAIIGHPSFTPEPDPTVFPIQAVADLQKLGLEGNVYNPDQFGGYLIWAFYPARRTLTDGRNELYHGFLADYEKARLDSRAWNAMIQRYGLVLAVDEYRPKPMETVDAVTGAKKELPASLVYFPRDRWALVAWDDVGMVFARRDAFPREFLDREEFRSLVPDATSPDNVAIGDPATALGELRREVETNGLSPREAFLLGLLRARAENGAPHARESRVN